LSQGEDVIIAVIDDGMDLNHDEFSGSGKIVSPRDVTRRTNVPTPGPGDNHGTACAGVACASGLHGASGVAPKANLMPIRLRSGLGSQAEADAFVWAADHEASVISCSWGPPDGRWWDPTDPRHHQVVPLPDSTRLAIDHAINNGRNGKGCVICWAAGNGNESVENDGYASYDKVISVAACSDRGDRSVYSDVGASNWCCFPSNNFRDNGSPAPLTPGIWTTDRSGTVGYNESPSPAGDFTEGFGGTSSACPAPVSPCRIETIGS
jgi:subtilisin family serine protease